MNRGNDYATPDSILYVLATFLEKQEDISDYV